MQYNKSRSGATVTMAALPALNDSNVCALNTKVSIITVMMDESPVACAPLVLKLGTIVPFLRAHTTMCESTANRAYFIAVKSAIQ